MPWQPFIRCARYLFALRSRLRIRAWAVRHFWLFAAFQGKAKDQKIEVAADILLSAHNELKDKAQMRKELEMVGRELLTQCIAADTAHQ